MVNDMEAGFAAALSQAYNNWMISPYDNGMMFTTSHYGMLWRNWACRWDFTSPAELANTRSASDWSPISCSAGFTPSRRGSWIASLMDSLERLAFYF